MTSARLAERPGVDATAWRGFRLVPVLLLARLRMIVNGLFRGGRGRRATTVMVALVAGAAWWAGYGLTAEATAGTGPAPDTVARVVAGACGMVAGFTLVTSLTFALAAMYFAGDLDLLHTSPMPPRAIVLTKMCLQLGVGAVIGIVIVSAPLAAYLPTRGAVQALPWIGLTVLAMAALPLAAGTAITVCAVRLLPARRVRDAGGLLVTVAVFGVTAVNLVLRGASGFTRAPGLLDPSRSSGVSDSPLLPPGVAARSIDGAIRGDWVAAMGWGLPLVLAAAVALVAVSALVERPYLTGFVRTQEASGGGRRRRARRAVQTRTRPRRPWLVLVGKDLREIRRDPSQLGQLALPLALFALYIAAPTAGSSLDEQGGRLPVWYGTALTAGFASLFAASGVALRGVGMEGRRMWVLRAAPLDAAPVLKAKLAVGTLVAVALGSLLVLIGCARQHVDPITSALVIARLAVIVTGLCALAVGAGAIWPRLDWTDPRRAVGIATSIGFLAAGSAYLGASFVILALPYGGSNAPSRLAVSVGDLSLCLLAGLAVGGSLLVATARLRRLEI